MSQGQAQSVLAPVSPQAGAIALLWWVMFAFGARRPPLTATDREVFLAGVLPNTADAMILWISDPRGVSPGTAMPDMTWPRICPRSGESGHRPAR